MGTGRSIYLRNFLLTAATESAPGNLGRPVTLAGSRREAAEAKTRGVYLRKAQARRLDFALRASLFETKTWNDKNRADSPTSSGLQPQRSEKQALATTLPASRYVYLERAMVKRQEHRRCRSTQKTELPHP